MPRSRSITVAGITAASAIAIAHGAAPAPLKLPLTLVDRQAYVATIEMNGESLSMQVGTWSSDTWVACTRALGNECKPLPCASTLWIETDRFCSTERTVETLTIHGTEGASMTVDNAVVSVLQYHDMEEDEEAKNDTDCRPPCMRATYEAEQPPLLATTQGVLGLGLNTSMTRATPTNRLPHVPLVTQYGSFAVYISDDDDGAGSYVHLGGAIDEDTLRKWSLTTAYPLSLRAEPVDRNDPDGSTVVMAWKVSIIGVRFDENEPLYPREYRWDEPVGGDTFARLSLNTPELRMPSTVFRVFEEQYLTGCDVGKTSVTGVYYSCDPSMLETLPRIGLYLDTKSFFLDPVDYTHVSPTRSRLHVSVAADSHDERWVLGTPFLKKFPTVFNAEDKTVDVHCAVGASCRPMGVDPLARQPAIDGNGGGVSSSSNGGTSSSPGGDVYPVTTSAPGMNTRVESEYQYPTIVLVVLWLSRAFGVLVICVLVYGSVRACILQQLRGGLSANDDNMTMASECDLDETKAELRRMAAAEEDGQGQEATGPASPTTYTLIQSPHRV